MSIELINIALTQYGVKEIKGSVHNPEVLKYFDATSSSHIAISDETSWCSAFVSWVAFIGKYKRSKSLTARSWLNVGQPITNPKIGDIVVFWRESKNSWKGHVGFYVNEDKDNIYCLGGNQSNEVNITKYSKTRLLGFRRLLKT